MNLDPLSKLPPNPKQDPGNSRKTGKKIPRTVGFNPPPPSSDSAGIDSHMVSDHIKFDNAEKVTNVATERLGMGSELSISDRIELAETQYEAIQNLWVNHEKKILDKSAEFYYTIDNNNLLMNKDELKKAHDDLYNDFNNLRNEYNKALATLVEALEKNLNQIAELYNKEVEDPTVSKKDLEKKMNSLNNKKMQSHLTTSSQHATEYKIIQFQGIVEKKYNLAMKILDLNTPDKERLKLEAELRKEPLSLQKREKLLRHRKVLISKIDRSQNEKKVKELMQPKSINFLFKPIKWLGALISKLSGIPSDLTTITNKLVYCPDNTELKNLNESIKKELSKPRLTLSTLDAMKSYKSENELLAWGEDSKHLALCNPAFWVDKYDVSLTISTKGRASIYETKIEPLNIDSRERGEASGYGSMMRSEGSRAANAQKTTLSIIDFDNKGKKVTTPPIERFRIGQFPTEAAAIDALKIILKNSSEKVTSLHDNMLLTASKFADKKLALEHKKNLKAALEKIRNSTDDDGILAEINQNRKEGELYSRQDIANLQKNYIQTNFGVNEGAIGKLKVGVTLSSLKIGWKRAFKEFNNPSAKQYNRIIQDKLEKLSEKKVEELDERDMRLIERLGAIVQVGQELEEIWFREDYKNPDVGANQFKAPALLSALDSLLDITVNTHCKSAKDRASMVEAHALEVLQTIEANLLDRRKELEIQLKELKAEPCNLHANLDSEMYIIGSTQKFLGDPNKELIFSEKSLNLLSCLTSNQIKEIYPSLVQLKSEEAEKTLFNEVSSKIENASASLGLKKNNGFLIPKRSHSEGRSLPLREISASSRAAKEFEQIAPTSLYKTRSFDPIRSVSEEDRKLLVEMQRQKKHRRMACQLAMDVTKENTGVPGDKLKQGEPLKKFYSGFHRDYVRYQFFNTETNELKEELTDAMGLDEIDDKTKRQIIAKALRIKNVEPALTKKDQLKQLNKVIKEVEKIKYRQFYPMTKVKS